MKQDLLQKRLLKLKNSNNIQFSNKLKINEEYSILGLKTEQIKEIAKEIAIEEGLTHIDEFLNYKKAFYYEEVIITYFVFSYVEKNMERSIFHSYLNKLLKFNNSWATNDTIALSIKIRKKDLLLHFNYLKEKLKSNNPWDVRFSIVSLMKSYLNDDYIEETLYILSTVIKTDYYVEMALGWAYATALAKQREKTYPYFFEKKIRNTVNKKAIQKSIESKRISDSDKFKLKLLREEINLELKKIHQRF